MQFYSVRDLNTSPKEIWLKLAESGEIVITNNGKPAALMIDVANGDVEETISAVRQANAMRAVNRMRLQARQTGADSLSAEEIQNEIAAARKER